MTYREILEKEIEKANGKIILPGDATSRRLILACIFLPLIIWKEEIFSMPYSMPILIITFLFLSAYLMYNNPAIAFGKVRKLYADVICPECKKPLLLHLKHNKHKNGYSMPETLKSCPNCNFIFDKSGVGE